MKNLKLIRPACVRFEIIPVVLAEDSDPLVKKKIADYGNNTVKTTKTQFKLRIDIYIYRYIYLYIYISIYIYKCIEN